MHNPLSALVDRLSQPLDLAGRVLLGLYFLLPGLMKIVAFAATVSYMTQHHVPYPAPLLVVATVLEVGGGLALVLGWQTKVWAFVLAGLTLLICYYLHDFWHTYAGGSTQHELQNFVKDLGIFAGLLTLAGRGAPRLSLDGKYKR